MKYFPVFFNLQKKSCVVVGGGRVAERKIRNLRKAGALVTVVSPRLTAGLQRLKEEKQIKHLSRPYRSGDLKSAYLAVAATSERRTNEKVFREATTLRIPINTVDDPVYCTFIVPAVISRGDLLIAISTGGQSPALAKTLRKKLQQEIGPEYPALLKIIGDVRKRILPLRWGQKETQRIYSRLLQKDVIRMVRQKKPTALKRLIKKIIGPGVSLEGIGLKT